MARVYLTKPVTDLRRAYSPAERQEVRRALRLLQNDVGRDAGKIDFSLEEDGLKIWGFFPGTVSLAFVEAPGDDITVVHIAMLSPFGSLRAGG